MGLTFVRAGGRGPDRGVDRSGAGATGQGPGAPQPDAEPPTRRAPSPRLTRQLWYTIDRQTMLAITALSHGGPTRSRHPGRVPASAERLIRFTDPGLIRDGIVGAMRDAIISGRLRPGERIREREIVASLQVSRSPLREAIRILETEGLVTTVAHRGACVTELTRADLRHTTELRVMVETFAVRLTVDRLAGRDARGDGTAHRGRAAPQPGARREPGARPLPRVPRPVRSGVREPEAHPDPRGREAPHAALPTLRLREAGARRPRHQPSTPRSSTPFACETSPPSSVCSSSICSGCRTRSRPTWTPRRPRTLITRRIEEGEPDEDAYAWGAGPAPAL